MKVERLPKLFGEADVPAKRLELPVTVGRGVEKVQAGLADADHLVRRLRQRLQGAVVVVGEGRLEVHGVHAHAGIDRVENGGQARWHGQTTQASSRRRTIIPTPAASARGNHRVELVVGEEIKVRVRIGQHGEGSTLRTRLSGQAPRVHGDGSLAPIAVDFDGDSVAGALVLENLY